MRGKKFISLTLSIMTSFRKEPPVMPVVPAPRSSSNLLEAKSVGMDKMIPTSVLPAFISIMSLCSR